MVIRPQKIQDILQKEHFKADENTTLIRHLFKTGIKRTDYRSTSTLGPTPNMGRLLIAFKENQVSYSFEENLKRWI